MENPPITIVTGQRSGELPLLSSTISMVLLIESSAMLILIALGSPSPSAIEKSHVSSRATKIVTHFCSQVLWSGSPAIQPKHYVD
jgi:hypothetical protein